MFLFNQLIITKIFYYDLFMRPMSRCGAGAQMVHFRPSDHEINGGVLDGKPQFSSVLSGRPPPSLVCYLHSKPWSIERGWAATERRRWQRWPSKPPSPSTGTGWLSFSSPMRRARNSVTSAAPSTMSTTNFRPSSRW